MTNVNDKILHFLVSFCMTILIFVASAALRTISVRCRLVLTTITAFAIGLIKELGDGWLPREWPWCPPCTADVHDLYANVIGIVMALLGIVHVRAVVPVIASILRKMKQSTTTISSPASMPTSTNEGENNII